MKSPPVDLRDIRALIEIMAALRDGQGGCPWDLEQTFETIAPYTIEEAYEVADAIARKDIVALKGELGDLLFQVVYHARIAEEDGAFTFADVVAAIGEKLVRRHPHVFGTAQIASAEHQTKAWEYYKAEERASKGHASALDDVPLALPALKRAEKLQKRIAAEGFAWNSVDRVLPKLREEVAEIEAEMSVGNAAKVAAEFGDLLFVMVVLGRHLGVDCEDALRHANNKFEARLRWIEAALHDQGKTMREQSLEALEALWAEAKTKMPAP